jgi:hypothetical protein
MSILEARGIHKTYESRGVQTPALRGIDLALDEGEEDQRQSKEEERGAAPRADGAPGCPLTTRPASRHAVLP